MVQGREYLYLTLTYLVDREKREQDLLARMVVKRLPSFDLISDRAEEEEDTEDEKDVVTDNLGDIGR